MLCPCSSPRRSLKTSAPGMPGRDVDSSRSFHFSDEEEEIDDFEFDQVLSSAGKSNTSNRCSFRVTLCPCSAVDSV